MDSVIHLDTHVVVWLYAGDLTRLRPISKKLNKSELMISPIVMLELEYLFVIDRVAESAQVVFLDLVERIGLRTSDASFSQVVQKSITLNWTRDPFDRLIVANAIVDNHPLITFDERIRSNYSMAVWR